MREWHIREGQELTQSHVAQRVQDFNLGLRVPGPGFPAVQAMGLAGLGSPLLRLL